MVSIPQTYEPVQAQEQIITNLQSALHQSEVLRKQLVHELTKFKEREQWEKRLFANPHISASQKLALWATTSHLTSDNFTHVNITYVSKQIGMSPKTTGRNLQEIAEAQGLQRDTTTVFAPDGTQQTKVFFAATSQTHKPHLITPPTPRNHGGKRYCKDCGSDNLIEQTTITCMDCGAEQHKSHRLINPKTKTTDTQLDPRHNDDQHIDHDIVHDRDHSAQVNMTRSNNIDTTNVHIAPDTAPDLEGEDNDHSDNHGTNGTHGNDDQYKDYDGTNGTHDHVAHLIALDSIPPIDNLSLIKNQKEPADNLSIGSKKPPTPPLAAIVCSFLMPDTSDVPPAILPMQTMKERPRPAMPTGRQAEQETERELDKKTAQLLLDMAGDTQEHIVMNTNPRHPKKYLTVNRPLTLEDMRQHLLGTKTVGTTLARHDGTTHTLCFDGDDDRAWQALTTSAQLLIATGYRPLLEPSPAGRGGHLWIIFTERVNAKAAYREVCAIVPVLKDCEEYWPNTGNQKVRLPAGKYVTPAFSAWTHLYDAHGDELPTSALLTHQTPAELIPAPSDTTEPQSDVFEADRRNRDERSVTKSTEHGGVDEYHRSKYGKHAMWVEWPTEQYLIDRFNAQHTIDDLATRERGGMINASLIGRPERTASVGVTKDGGHFTDFGAGARKADGTPDGGDAFEFYIRLHQLDKAEVLRELGAALNREASRELLRAARAGELPPAWVMDIITDKGREVYNQNANRHGHNTLEEHLVKHRGVDGFSDVGKDEKQGVCLPWQVEQQSHEQGIPEDFTMDTPCEHCGCCLYRNMLGSVVCVRCYPPRGYHLYSDLIDAKYPRRKC